MSAHHADRHSNVHISKSRRIRNLLLATILFCVLTITTANSRHILRVPASTCSAPTQATESSIAWSDYAYVQYVTKPSYLCNSMMILESLKRLGSKADRVLMYPKTWIVTPSTYEGRLLDDAEALYQAKLIPVEVQISEGGDPTWTESYTKLLAFNQTQYKRIIALDSDGTVLQHMDELFSLPPAPLAMPRAFGKEDSFFFSSQIAVITPSATEWSRVQRAIEAHRFGEFDMEILNQVYRSSMSVIPHRYYGLLTREFTLDNHEKFLGSTEEVWDARKILNETKYVHFSDWPMQKPWYESPEDVVRDNQPKCRKVDGAEDCSDREVWLELHADFARRRKRICGHSYDG